MVISEEKAPRKPKHEAVGVGHNPRFFNVSFAPRTDHLEVIDASAYGLGLARVVPVGIADDYSRCLLKKCGVPT